MTSSSDQKSTPDLLEHLRQERHLQLERYTSVYVDPEDNVATFYIWNLSGQLVGFHTYRPDRDKLKRNDPKEGRYYTFLTECHKSRALGVWGLETYDYHPDVLCLTEGVFDACRLHNFGLPAVAVFSNDPKHLRPWFRILPKRTIGFRDNDAAGANFIKFFDESRTMSEKDLGDSSEEEIMRVIEDLL